MSNITELNTEQKDYEEALHRILDSNRLELAKEIAANVLEVDLEDHLANDLDELDFNSEDNEDLDFEFLGE